MNRFSSPEIDLGMNPPTGIAAEIINLIKSAHDRLGISKGIETYFELMGLLQTDAGNKTELVKLCKLVGVGMGQCMAQLLHIRRLYALKNNMPTNTASNPDLLLKTAYKEGLFKVGKRDQPTLFGEKFLELSKKTVKTIAVSVTPDYIPPARYRLQVQGRLSLEIDPCTFSCIYFLIHVFYRNNEPGRNGTRYLE